MANMPEVNSSGVQLWQRNICCAPSAPSTLLIDAPLTLTPSQDSIPVSAPVFISFERELLALNTHSAV